MTENEQEPIKFNESSKEKLNHLARIVLYLEEDVKKLIVQRQDLDARVRVLEAEDTNKMKHDLYKLESRMSSFESDHDDRKENWKMILNFIAQLLWVAMAAWLLTELGLQAPL